MSRWYESIDRARGCLPIVKTTDETVVYEFSIVGGVMQHQLFAPTKRTRLGIRCDRSGAIVVRILEGRSSAV